MIYQKIYTKKWQNKLQTAHYESIYLKRLTKIHFGSHKNAATRDFVSDLFFNADVPGSEKVIKNFSNLLPATATSSSINDDMHLH